MDVNRRIGRQSVMRCYAVRPLATTLFAYHHHKRRMNRVGA